MKCLPLSWYERLRGNRVLSLHLVLLPVVLAFTCPEADTSQVGQVDDGHVDRIISSDPLEPTVSYNLVERWRASVDAAGSPLFGSVTDVVTDSSGNLYILDSQLQQVLVISQDGRVLRRLGAYGEGPGEFLFAADLTMVGDGLLGIVDAQKGTVVLMQSDGTPLGTWVPHWEPESRLEPLMASAISDGFVISCKTRERTDEEMIYRYFLGLFNSESSHPRILLERRSKRRLGRPLHFDERESESFAVFATSDVGEIYAAPEFAAYRIHVFGAGGKLERIIGREYESVARTQQRKAAIREVWEAYFSQWRGTTVSVASSERDVQNINIRPDGQLWIETSQGWFRNPDGVALTLDEFDCSGRFRRHVQLLGEIDAANDFLLIRGSVALRITSGVESLGGWLGSEPDEPQDSVGEDVPALILYDLCLVTDQ
ncbi:MAG: 6-bladed beta-propeller [Candidatus Eisenbacteria bacterium]|nr:6-bladed beta-propeller [Candidatus Eisenbacteria bacterium]